MYGLFGGRKPEEHHHFEGALEEDTHLGSVYKHEGRSRSRYLMSKSAFAPSNLDKFGAIGQGLRIMVCVCVLQLFSSPATYFDPYLFG